jgi:hypothetical protein
MAAPPPVIPRCAVQVRASPLWPQGCCASAPGLAPQTDSAKVRHQRAAQARPSSGNPEHQVARCGGWPRRIRCGPSPDPERSGKARPQRGAIHRLGDPARRGPRSGTAPLGSHLKTFGRVLPIGMTLSLVLAIILASNGGARPWSWSAVAAFAASLAITLVVNVPINLATDAGTPSIRPGLERSRSRWEFFSRCPLLVAGWFVLVCAASTV